MEITFACFMYLRWFDTNTYCIETPLKGADKPDLPSVVAFFPQECVARMTCLYKNNGAVSSVGGNV